jgi:tetratricopeptide (TPR) repeat protein
VLAAEGHDGEALALATTVVEACRERDFRLQLARGLRVLGELRRQAGDEEGAATAFGESLEEARRFRDPSLEGEAAVGLAALLLDQGAVAEAEPLVAVAARYRPMAADSLRLQSRLAAAHGDAPRALELLGEARDAAGERWSEDDEAAFDRLRADLAATGGR